MWRKTNRNTREEIQKAIDELLAEGKIVDTGWERWSPWSKRWMTVYTATYNAQFMVGQPGDRRKKDGNAP